MASSVVDAGHMFPEKIQDVSNVDQLVAELNERHAVVMIGGSCRILNEEIDPDTGYRRISFSSFSDFEKRYSNQKVKVGDDWIGLGRVWHDHAKRREYEGIVFSPEGDRPGYFNLWQGFAVKPKEGNCERYLEHLHVVVCRGDKDHFLWLLAWMADIVQRPANRPGTAVVLRGKQGTGKTLACAIFGSLLGDHFCTVSQPRHLLGNFNAHLNAKVLVLAEEAFWAGDKQAEGALKDLVTGESLNIEQKFVDVQKARNLIRLMITSNHDWVVPAGMEERRFFVLDVSDDRMQDKPYFKAIVEEMNNGGREALLLFLMHHDYSGIDLRTIPQTEGLWIQKHHSLDAVAKFWFEVLTRGSFSPKEDTWPEYIRKSEFRDLYYETAGKAGQKHKGWETEIGHRMKQLCPQVQSKRKLLPVPHEKGFPLDEKTQQMVYVFPDLETCRNLFDEATTTKHPWPSTEPEEEVVTSGGVVVEDDDVDGEGDDDI